MEGHHQLYKSGQKLQVKESQPPGPYVCPEGPEVKCDSQILPATMEKSPPFPRPPALFAVSLCCQPRLVAPW